MTASQSCKSARRARRLSTGHGRARSDIKLPSQIMRQFTTFDPTRLQQLGRKMQRLRADVEQLRPELAEEIRAAAAAGMAQVDIVKATGYTRDQIRQICLPPEMRRWGTKTGT